MEKQKKLFLSALIILNNLVTKELDLKSLILET